MPFSITVWVPFKVACLTFSFPVYNFFPIILMTEAAKHCRILWIVWNQLVGTRWRAANTGLNFVCLSCCQAAGVMSVYLFMKRYTAEEMYRPHQGFYRPRLSNCSDYSGQFLHPDAWTGRGRSPSSISSEASLQMNSSNYPALLKCPEYEQMSSSPCWVWDVGAHSRMLKRKKRRKNSLKKSLKICRYPALIPLESECPCGSPSPTILPTLAFFHLHLL